MYRIKEGVELPKEFKVKVNPKQSEALQNHLFSLGYGWANNGKNVKDTDHKYLFFICDKLFKEYMDSRFYFNRELSQRIKFKDYFEKVVKDFPEKWCILVTKDNYKELSNWVHKNKENYVGFDKYWFTFEEQSVGNYLYCEGYHRWDKGLKDIFYEEITTEQFRQQYGKVVKALFDNEQIDWRQKCSDLESENQNLKLRLSQFNQLAKQLINLIDQ